MLAEVIFWLILIWPNTQIRPDGRCVGAFQSVRPFENNYLKHYIYIYRTYALIKVTN